jgi:hypothetical protein
MGSHPVQWTADTRRPTVEHMGIDHGRIDLAMSQQLLAPPLFPPPSFPTFSIENLSSSPVILDSCYRESILGFSINAW